jgi:hypothetical protein
LTGNPLDQHYDASLKHLCNQMSEYSPSTILLLEKMKLHHGSQITYYAAFVLVCLKAKQQKDPHKRHNTVTSHDLQDFTFFEFARDNSAALALFDELLLCYQRDQTNVTHLLDYDISRAHR